MKALPWLLVIILSLFILTHRQEEKPEVKIETKTITSVKVDTLWMTPRFAFFTITLPGETIRIGDTIVLREQAIYKDSSYIAYVSGYKPRLDSLLLFPKTITNNIVETKMIVPKPKRWGVGAQVGYSIPHGAYVGIGVSYNIFQW